MKEIKIKGRIADDWSCERWADFETKDEGINLSLNRYSTLFKKTKLELGDKVEVIIRKV